MTETSPRARQPSPAIRESHDIAPASYSSPWPLTCRWPENRTPKAFVIFCHGLGSNGKRYSELSRHWAESGYLVIHPTFPDWINAVAAAEPGLGLDPQSDLSDWASVPNVRARLHEILHKPSSWLKRLKTVQEVMDLLDQIMALTCGAADEPLPGAIAGHSFGAYTAQLLAGAQIDMPGQQNVSFADSRVKAAILLSAQGRDQQGLRDGSWDRMGGPVLNITGTRDQGAKGGDWHWKCEPYELAPPGDKYLAVLEDGDHFLGGISNTDRGADVPAQRAAVAQLTLDFLDTTLVHDMAARARLSSISDRIGECRLSFRRK